MRRVAMRATPLISVNQPNSVTATGKAPPDQTLWPTTMAAPTATVKNACNQN